MTSESDDSDDGWDKVETVVDPARALSKWKLLSLWMLVVVESKRQFYMIGFWLKEHKAWCKANLALSDDGKVNVKTGVDAARALSKWKSLGLWMLVVVESKRQFHMIGAWLKEHKASCHWNLALLK